MRLVFMGTPAFAVPTLEALIGSHHEICLIVTNPDRPAGPGRPPPTPSRGVSTGERRLDGDAAGDHHHANVRVAEAGSFDGFVERPVEG